MPSASEPNPLEADTDVGEFTLPACQQDTATEIKTQRPDGTTVPVIPGYEVIRELGRGGMGVVYLARDHALDREVALKTFRAEANSPHCNLLADEARLSGKLSHVGIVPIFEVNPSCSTPYFSMAYIPGANLAQRISKQVYTPSDAAQLGMQVAAAMQHAHQFEVLHLDLKPANILLCQEGNAKVTDFGLFAMVDAGDSRGGALGTPQFMSPEQALQDTEKISASSDIYSIGAVLYAAITGRPPLVATNNQELIMKVASQRPRPLAALIHRVPAALDAIVMKCLEKSPQKRYATAQDLHDDLERFVDGKPVTARPNSVVGWMRYQVQTHVLAASVSGSLVFLLLVATLASILFQAYENHYHVQRLEDELQSQRQVSATYAAALLKRTGGKLVDQTVIGEFTRIAVELSGEGKDGRAAVIAADTFLLADVHGVVVDSDLQPIIRGYKLEWQTDDSTPISEMARIISEENK